jgi:DNA-binding PadR family transcriptional regulator
MAGGRSGRTRRAAGANRRADAEDMATLFAALGHRLRVHIVLALAASDVPLSPSGIDQQLGEDSPGLPNLAYHMRTLSKAKLVRKHSTAQRRGAIEHFYALTERGERAVTLIERY